MGWLACLFAVWTAIASVAPMRGGVCDAPACRCCERDGASAPSVRRPACCDRDSSAPARAHPVALAPAFPGSALPAAAVAADRVDAPAVDAAKEAPSALARPPPRVPGYLANARLLL